MTSCEICGAPVLPVLTVQGYVHYRCAECKHLFVYPKPGTAVLEAFYQAAEYYCLAEAQRSRLARQASQRLAKLEMLCRQFGLAKHILDIGCASGIFLREAVRSGWESVGIDRSEKIVRQARQFSGSVVISGLLEDTDIPGSPFAVVAAWEVIEHAIDPRAFLRAALRHVLPGGLLVLSTPLSNGLPARILGARFPMLAPPEHLSLFSRKSLNLLAKEHGLDEVKYSSFSNLGPKSLASGLRECC